MSEREFENYLVLLSRLLRLSPAQRDAIGVELGDHLEERLEQLTARGVARDDAVRMALEEFGDAAGLAGEFSVIARNSRRRWMMRLTAGTIAAVAATILIAMALWPDPQAGPAPQQATAQQSDAPEKAVPETAKTSAAGDRAVPTEAELNAASAAKLAKPGSVQFIETPLVDMLATVGRQYHVQFYLDKKSLSDKGIGSDSPITSNLSRVPMDMLLDLMLGELDLTYYLRNGVAIVTTEDTAQNERSVRVYNVNDLLIPALSDDPHASAGPLQKLRGKADQIMSYLIASPNGSDKAVKQTIKDLGELKTQLQASTATVDMYQARAERLIELITSCIGPDTWAEVGGPGSIEFYKGALVISQTSEVHRQIGKLLAEIRQSTAGNPDIPLVQRNRSRGGGGFGGGGRR